MEIMFDWADLIRLFIMRTQWSDVADVGIRWSIQSNIKHEQHKLLSELIIAYTGQNVTLDWSGPNFLSWPRAVAIVLVQKSKTFSPIIKTLYNSRPYAAAQKWEFGYVDWASWGFCTSREQSEVWVGRLVYQIRHPLLYISSFPIHVCTVWR